ncbi:hypothetical protein [Uliginosibacterium sp. H1]|uniref:hypothetical protein n=1 Tax=Uliginosibacterium sp. H1 TaxID=3114757 RepID=UPI002E19212E|nr:hypothetical protein [Uliginosibacterium sp. H1]
MRLISFALPPRLVTVLSSALLLALQPLPVSAAPRVSCTLEEKGSEKRMSVATGIDALQGEWTGMGVFRVRTLLAAPPGREPWLLVEVYAEAADGDYRILSSQKVGAPFATGNMEVVEPGLGRSFHYACGAAK